MTAFEEMGVMPEIAQAVEEMDWMLPTDIQNEAIPLILGGGDVLMAAETGSGKTGAFCLPVIQIVYETLKDKAEGKTSKLKPKKGGSTQWKMNVFDRGNSMAIDGEGVLCQARDAGGWHGTRTNKAVRSSGKYYYEARVTDEGLCRVGWSTPEAKLDVGTDKQSYGFGGTGRKSFGRQFDPYGESYGLSDVIGCYLDLDLGVIKWSKNGVDLGKAYDLDPRLRRSAFHASVTLKNAEIHFNFGDKPFAHPPGEKWRALCRAEPEFVSESTVGAAPAPRGDTAKGPQAIVVEPSRELAEQTYNQIKLFKKHLKNPAIREVLVTGGGDTQSLLTSLRGGVDIVVATPGKLDDLVSSGNLSLAACRFFVLDEVDGLLSQGHSDLINRLHAKIPKVTNDGKRLQMIVCSATLHNFDVKKMAERLMSFPTWVDLKGQDSVPETVHHVVCLVDPRRDQRWTSLMSHVETDGVHLKDKLTPGYESPEMISEAIKMLKGEYCVNAIREHKMDRAIVFCRTKLDCDNLEKYLQTLGGGPRAPRNHQFSCVCLHSDRRPPERKANLDKFKHCEVRFLICTDVAARGLDITGLPFVINVTLPDEKQNYVHRIGRVGRADRMGLAISLVASDKEKVWYHSNCSSKGRGCYNTQLVTRGGCCIWYNEPQYLADIEEHLGVTVDQVQADLKVPLNEFDGKVTYGQRRQQSAEGAYRGHVQQLAPTVSELAELETRAQTSFLRMRFPIISS